MWDRIVFYELRHYGDLHITRNFVRYVMDRIPARQYTYVLKASPKVFSDFPTLTFEVYDPTIHPFTDYSAWSVVNDVLYVNTSCGANEMNFFQGTTIQSAYAIFEHYLQVFCNHKLDKDLSKFIPSIDFSYFKIGNVDSYIKSSPKKRKVLFVNGLTQSGQSPNFDMTSILVFLAQYNPHILFFVSNKEDYTMKKTYAKHKNILFCKDIIGISENDIVETSYFSRFCDIIVGRSSGVYTLSIEQENILNKPKKFITIGHAERDKDLGIVSLYPALANNFVWSNEYSFGGMVDLIQNHIRL